MENLWVDIYLRAILLVNRISTILIGWVLSRMLKEFYLGKWQVFPSQQSVSNGKERIKLEPKAMDLLIVLASAEGEVVSREFIFEQVWKNQIIADHVLYNLIANLRKVLEDDPHHPQIIITVPKKGYRLLAQAESPLQQGNITDEKTDKPSWLKSALVLSVLVLVGVLSWRFYQTDKITLDSADIKTKNQSAPSIAVLPFDVFHSQVDTQYFADGLVEEIIHQLTVIPDLAVTARTSSFAFRDQGLDIQALAHKLNVNYLLEGSVRKDQNILRITVQLIKVEDSTHLWSKVFNVEEQEIFTLQQDISLAVVQSLAPEYTLQSSGRLRKHPELGDAYMHFLRGSAMAAKATPEYIQKALIEFEQAVALQPDYALAHIAIGMNKMVLYQYRLLAPDVARSSTQKAIDIALGVDQFMPVAFAAQGLLHINFGEFEQAEKAFLTALELDPKLALAHHNYGYLLWIQDNHSKALNHFNIALAHNPMSAITNFAVADSLFVTGQLSAALKQFQHCVALLPDYPACHLGLANLYRFTMQADKTLEHMDFARQQLPEKNIYMITADAVDYFHRGEYDAAWQKQEQVALVKGGGYLENQLKSLIYLHKDELNIWLQELEFLAQQWPENSSLKMALGLNYYFSNDCARSLMHYESVISDDAYLRGKFNVMAWGISHLANMAFCYRQQGSEKEQQMLVLLEAQINQYDLDNFDTPGADLVKAKLLLLTNEPDLAKVYLESHPLQTWQLNWLVDKDTAIGFLTD